MTPASLLHTLERWRNAGWLRNLDLALARFIDATDPGVPASLLLGAALTANMEGRGHSALPIAALAADPLRVLAWPDDAAGELHAALAGWPADDAALRDAWQGLNAVELDPADGAGTSPLVASCGLLYLRRYWRYEVGVAAQVNARAASVAQSVDPAAARELLGKLFAPRAPGDDAPDWQKVACALALRGRLTLVTGGPGTGKTYTAARLLVALQSLHDGDRPLRVALAAPTGKAAARLRESIVGALHELDATLAAALALDRWVDSLGPARTLHALLGAQPGTRRFRHDAANPLDVDLLIVDEASMVHVEMMARLLAALPGGARVVLLGDSDQLASVEAGSVLADLCQGALDGATASGYRSGTAHWIGAVTGDALPPSELGSGSTLAQQIVVLRKSHRFDAPIGRLANAVNRGDADAALELLGSGPANDESGPPERARERLPIAAQGAAAAPAAASTLVPAPADGGAPALALIRAPDASAVPRLALQGRAGAPGGYRAYAEQLASRPRTAGAQAASFETWAASLLRSFDAFRVLCAVRDGPWGVGGLNAAIERALDDAGLLACRGEWYEGRPVMVTRNDPSVGVFNGDVGVVLRGPDGGDASLRCWFLDAAGLRSVSVARLAEVETAFAMTVHKSQGSEFEHVALVLPDADAAVVTRELVYTGITRAQRAFTLVAKQPAKLATALARLTQRVSGLRQRL